MKQFILFLFIALTCLGCDTKKSSIAGKVIYKSTGNGVDNALITFIQCKSDGDNCDEVTIGQAYTNSNGEFIIDKKTASKSKKKWITVFKNNKKLAQQNNIGLTDKNILVEVLP
jgi:hypothetical protein